MIFIYLKCDVVLTIPTVETMYTLRRWQNTICPDKIPIYIWNEILYFFRAHILIHL